MSSAIFSTLLAYRLVSFWLPLPAGLAAYIAYRRRYGHPSLEAAEAVAEAAGDATGRAAVAHHPAPDVPAGTGPTKGTEKPPRKTSPDWRWPDPFVGLLYYDGAGVVPRHLSWALPPKIGVAPLVGSREAA